MLLFLLISFPDRVHFPITSQNLKLVELNVCVCVLFFGFSIERVCTKDGLFINTRKNSSLVCIWLHNSSKDFLEKVHRNTSRRLSTICSSLDVNLSSLFFF